MTSQTNSCVKIDVEWALNHLDDPQVRFVEVDWDYETYASGHAPGAIGWTWARDNARSQRMYASDKAAFGEMMSRSGIDNQTTVVLYGERDNLWATLAARLLGAYGHADVRLIDGGGKLWLSERRIATTKKPLLTPRQYEATEPNWAAEPHRTWETALNLLGLPEVTPKYISGLKSEPVPRPQDWDQPAMYDGVSNLAGIMCIGAAAGLFTGIAIGLMGK